MTVLDIVVWSETMVGSRNQLAKPDAEESISKLRSDMVVDLVYKPFGDGHAVKKIAEVINAYGE